MKTLTDFTREYVRVLPNGGAMLSTLSARYVQTAKELGLRHTPMIFELKHGRVSGKHYDTMAEVIEVIVCDMEGQEELLAAIHATVVWYWASMAPSFTSESLERLRILGREMRESWDVFRTPEVIAAMARDGSDIPRGDLDAIPKMHRAVAHLSDFIALYGPFESLTTETSEAANKPLKACFRTYVPLQLHECLKFAFR